MGLSVAERINRHLAGFLLVQSSRFQSVLLQLSDESRRQLAEFTRADAKSGGIAWALFLSYIFVLFGYCRALYRRVIGLGFTNPTTLRARSS